MAKLSDLDVLEAIEILNTKMTYAGKFGVLHADRLIELGKLHTAEQYRLVASGMVAPSLIPKEYWTVIAEAGINVSDRVVTWYSCANLAEVVFVLPWDDKTSEVK